MENGQRQSGSPEQVAGSREPQRAQRPEPGKVTRTSKLSPDHGPAVQRKATAPSSRAAAPQSRSSSDATMDTWMDAAHRGVTALAEPGQAQANMDGEEAASVHGVVQRRSAGESSERASTGGPQSPQAGQALVQELQGGDAGLGIKVPIESSWLGWLSAQRGGHDSSEGGNGNRAASGESMPPIESDDTATATRIEGTLFEQGTGDGNAVDINDVRQGALGDCYFLAVLASIARVRPDFIRSMVRDNGNGSYTVTFHTEQGLSGLFGSRSGQTVTVDNQFWASSGNPIYAGSGDRGAGGPELWVMIIEKAWAQLHGGYGNITGGNVDDDAREAVTGQEAEYIDPTDLSDTELVERLARHFSVNREPVIFWSHGDEKQEKLDRNGVITDHEYALNGVNRSAGTVTLYNPWGRRHLENVDMAFVRANFQSVRFLNLPSSR